MFLLGDIGRTKTRLAAWVDSETFSEPIIRPTPFDFGQGLALVKEFIKGEKCDGLCLGISRQVWPDATLKSEFEETFSAPVYLENDAALAGLGEAHRGAGRGRRIVVYVTVSTGVGGVKIEDGRIDKNAFGFEPGFQTIIVGDEPRSLEDLVSGASVARRFSQPPHKITDEKIWQELSHYLAVGLANTLVHWSPDCLILGGSMFKTPGFRVETIERLLGEYLTIFPKLPVVRPSALGEIGGLHGALVYLNQQRAVVSS